MQDPGLLVHSDVLAMTDTRCLLLQSVIMPGVRVGHGDSGPGCFTPTHEPAVTNGQLFGWEVSCAPLCLRLLLALCCFSVSDSEQSALLTIGSSTRS